MRLLYEMIGRLWVTRFLSRHRRELQLAALAAVVATGAAAYLAATRDVPEG